MEQTKRFIATGATILLAVTSAASLADARPGFGGHGFGGFGGHGFGGFGGHGFGGHAFSAHSFGGFAHHNFAGHAFARHAFSGHSIHAFRAHTGHVQHLAHAENGQLANQHSLANHNQLANQHPQNGIVHNGLAQNRLVHNALGASQVAHNQFWGQQFGARHFRYGNGFFWAGPVFWPFAFGDIFSFALWPYYDPFWDYGPDFLYGSSSGPTAKMTTANIVPTTTSAISTLAGGVHLASTPRALPRRLRPVLAWLPA